MEFDTKVDALSEEAPDAGEGSGAFGDLNDENIATISKQENGAEEVQYDFATDDGAGTGGGAAIGAGVAEDEDEDDDDDDDNINVTLGDVRKTGQAAVVHTSTHRFGGSRLNAPSVAQSQPAAAATTATAPTATAGGAAGDAGGEQDVARSEVKPATTVLASGPAPAPTLASAASVLQPGAAQKSAAAPGTATAPGRGTVDLDAPGNIGGVPTIDFAIETMRDEDKPWRRPGADVSDYFNYGFTENTWIAYKEKQRLLRLFNSGTKLPPNIDASLRLPGEFPVANHPVPTGLRMQQAGRDRERERDRDRDRERDRHDFESREHDDRASKSGNSGGLALQSQLQAAQTQLANQNQMVRSQMNAAQPQQGQQQQLTRLQLGVRQQGSPLVLPAGMNLVNMQQSGQTSMPLSLGGGAQLVRMSSAGAQFHPQLAGLSTVQPGFSGMQSGFAGLSGMQVSAGLGNMPANLSGLHQLGVQFRPVVGGQQSLGGVGMHSGVSGPGGMMMRPMAGFAPDQQFAHHNMPPGSMMQQGGMNASAQAGSANLQSGNFGNQPQPQPVNIQPMSSQGPARVSPHSDRQRDRYAQSRSRSRSRSRSPDRERDRRYRDPQPRPVCPAPPDHRRRRFAYLGQQHPSTLRRLSVRLRRSCWHQRTTPTRRARSRQTRTLAQSLALQGRTTRPSFLLFSLTVSSPTTRVAEERRRY